MKVEVRWEIDVQLGCLFQGLLHQIRVADKALAHVLCDLKDTISLGTEVRRDNLQTLWRRALPYHTFDPVVECNAGRLTVALVLGNCLGDLGQTFLAAGVNEMFTQLGEVCDR